MPFSGSASEAIYVDQTFEGPSKSRAAAEVTIFSTEAGILGWLALIKSFLPSDPSGMTAIERSFLSTRALSIA